MRWPRGQNELPLASFDTGGGGREGAMAHIKGEGEALYIFKGIKQRGLGGCFFVGFSVYFFFFLLGFGEGKDKKCLLSDTCSCHQHTGRFSFLVSEKTNSPFWLLFLE